MEYDKNTFIGNPDDYQWRSKQKPELTSAERQWWHEEAARQEIRREDYQRYADEAQAMRDRALEELGMLRRIGKAATGSEQEWLGNGKRHMFDMEREG